VGRTHVTNIFACKAQQLIMAETATPTVDHGGDSNPVGLLEVVRRNWHHDDAGVFFIEELDN
jgi:hypothetical protein